MKRVIKKSSTVLMVVIMLLSCWVWFAPTKADAGSYNISVTLDISEHRSSWLVCGVKYDGNDYSKADITVSCIASNGSTTKKTIDVIGSSEPDTYTVSFNTTYFPNEIRFDYGYLSQVSNAMLGGLSDIDVTVTIDQLTSSFTMNSSNVLSDGSSSVTFNAMLGLTIDTSVNYVYYRMKMLPNGYSFDEDSYGFSNYTTTFGLSKKYFTTMYEEASGKLLYSKKKNVSNGGLCYGMAYTTAAIFNGFPSVTTIYNGADEKRNSLREVKKTDYIKLRGGPISIDSYIKYAFIYQWSNEEVGNSLDAAIRDTLENNQLKCVIEINRWKTDNNGNFKLDKNGDKIPDGGHAVLFVGAAEIGNETIYYVNDSNSTKLEAITFKDGGWSYSKPWSGKVDNTNSTLSFSDAVNDPYLILNSGLKATVKQGITNNTSSTIEEVNEIYIEGMDRVNKDKMLLSIDSTDFELSTEDFIDISNVNFSESENEYENLTNLYWLNNDNTVTISDLSDENNIIELAGDNTILSANVSQNSTVTMTIDTQNIEADIETKKGEDFTVSVETIINDREIVAKVNGISDAETITATQTETGLLVTGISDGTVTLTKDEEVIATQEITNADSDIQINYDADGTSDDLDVEYESKSDDNNADDNSNNCSHICHKTGFMGFIWKIIRFFCKLFKANPVCDCGIAHY